MSMEYAIIVRNKTRLEELVERFNTKEQARFYLESSGGSFDSYQTEHNTFYDALQQLEKELQKHLKTKVLFRSFVPNYIFSDQELVIVLGQDGLVANVAKYVEGKPVFGINPDPDNYDGILLPYQLNSFVNNLPSILKGTYNTQPITLAKVSLNNGQSMLAFNDFFIGPNNHTSARYTLNYCGEQETQSSSGILVSTGAGSTGWFSSVVNMYNGLRNNLLQDDKTTLHTEMPWNTKMLRFVVREPFKSVVTGTDIVTGGIDDKNPLIIHSHMASKGIIFSDGVLDDYLEFNSGATATISIADQKAVLATP